jgi:hypothetical protein
MVQMKTDASSLADAATKSVRFKKTVPLIIGSSNSCHILIKPVRNQCEMSAIIGAKDAAVPSKPISTP